MAVERNWLVESKESVAHILLFNNQVIGDTIEGIVTEDKQEADRFNKVLFPEA